MSQRREARSRPLSAARQLADERRSFENVTGLALNPRDYPRLAVCFERSADLRQLIGQAQDVAIGKVQQHFV
jgi:hypothetical protein